MEKYIVEIEKLDHFGRGIARIDGKPVFIEGVLPFEKASISITKIKKNFMIGEVLEIISKSVDRVKPICPYFGNCGGCDIMHLSYPQQLEFKENKVKEIMEKFHINTTVQPIIASEDFFYRNKITLQVKEKVGLYKRKSYEIVPIDNCFISREKINELLLCIQQLYLNNISQIVIRVSSKESMVVIYANKKVCIDLSLLEKVTTVILLENKKEHILKGKGYIVEELLGLQFVISSTSFFQVNTLGMTKLYNQVLKYAELKGHEKVLDLYCGTGTIGLYLSKYCGKVLGIELNSQAIQDAIYNKNLNNIENIDFKVGDVGKLLQHTHFKPDVIIVDPPRAGLDTHTIYKIIELKPLKLIYISCDPVTLARDLNILKDTFDIQKVTPVDMFANTYHVECVGLLTLKSK